MQAVAPSVRFHPGVREVRYLSEIEKSTKYLKWMTPNKYEMHPACSRKWVSPRLDPLLYKTKVWRQGSIAIQQTSHLGHSADVLELVINARERTTFNIVGSCHNDSLSRLRTRPSSRNIVFATELTSLHEAWVNAADRVLVHVLCVLNELR